MRALSSSAGRTSGTALATLAVIVAALPAQARDVHAEPRAEAPFPLELLGSSDTLAPADPAELPAGQAGPAAPAAVTAGSGTMLHFGALGELGDLSGSEQIRFVDVPLPDGTTVDLDMQLVSTAGLSFGLHVDGQPAPGLLGKLGLTVYVGEVEGATQSSAALAFSQYGSRGWIQRDGDLFHLLAQAGPGGNWNQSVSTMVSDATLVAWGNQPQPPCEADALPKAPIAPYHEVEQKGSGNVLLPEDLYECTIAVETDDQLYALFGDVNAEATYITTLLTWISYRYEEQIQTVLTFPYVMFHTQGADPWVTQEQGGGSIGLLFEFQAAWGSSLPMNAKLAAFLSGANLGGGVAYAPGLCFPGYNFSVSGNIGGTVQFPVVQQGGNWDFIVAAHEIGHNFSALHTHDYCPPVDECPPSAYFGQCQTQQVCSSQGTVMSYCHLCAPGTANITTYFHPVPQADMRFWASSWCLPLYARTPEVYCTAEVNSQGCTPSIDAEGHPTLSGLDNLRVTASNVINQQDGLLFYGLTKGAKPFLGGTKCVLSPTWRTQVQNSGGSAATTVDCSGSFDIQLSHLLFQAKGLGPGTTVFAQYWSLDPQGVGGTNLTDALKLHLEP